MIGGAMRDRTADLFRAREALSQLSYSPNSLVAEAFQIEARHAKHQDGEAIRSWSDLVGLGRFELPTSPVSGVRSNQLSYRPVIRTLIRVARPRLQQKVQTSTVTLCRYQF